ncbi:activator-dependent family glycosyltransferase [Kibdelosporangium persicum]|uniref:Glycosyltransferase DesVII/glycosyltransferase OleGII/desosaminyltransferase OleGI n=1 Tax=Kibdelosporangium persicum TaxID=2698649 RepID=A0ABX2F6Q9_9PSEU|nr:activator-dependent family glycosyltransferase [Kibdelosporangium persicum]NRN66572.1 Glycosyltransferase DesVII/glycosyltransferase OleGII/desosaminyltransferase OleGI [Kibdelosporangium persicum]
MMRVLFTVFASKAHMYNVVSLAWAMRAAGHEVYVAGHPDLVDMITSTGLPAVAVGNALDMGGSWQGKGTWNQEVLSRGLSAPHEEQLRQGWDHVLGEFTLACGVRYEFLADQSFVDDMVKFACAWQPDLVVWDALTFAGPIAAIASGAAHARLLFGLDYVNRLYDDFRQLYDRQPPEQQDDPLTDWFTGRLSRIGVEYQPSMATELLTGQWTIDPMPSWMALPTKLPTVSMRAVPYNGPTTIPSWVYTRPDKPRVCLTLGVSMRELLGGAMVSTGELLTTLAELDIELIATLDASQLDSAKIPGNVTVVDFVPLNELLPSCSAIVHQAGFGTHTNAVTHGVPSIVIPDPFWDEAECGRLFEQRGAGLTLAPAEFTPEALRTKLATILEDPSYRYHAGEIQQDLLAAPTPHDIIPRLEELTRLNRGRA